MRAVLAAMLFVTTPTMASPADDDMMGQLIEEERKKSDAKSGENPQSTADKNRIFIGPLQVEIFICPPSGEKHRASETEELPSAFPRPRPCR